MDWEAACLGTGMPGIPVATEIAQSQTHEAGSTESKGIGSQARSEQA